MTSKNLKFLLAEKSQLEDLIANLQSFEILDRASLEHRLSKVNESVSKFDTGQRVPAKMKLTFRGRPVIGSHGMDADFASKIMVEFSNTLASVSASRDGPVPSKGRIPGRSGKRVLITSTAIGSFGFELEEVVDSADPNLRDSTPSDLEQAFETTQQILEGARTSSNDVFAETLSNIGDRTIGCLRSFLKTLSDSEATFAIDFKDRLTRYRDLSEIVQAFQRLVAEVQEDERVITGLLLGILPVRRSFEFQLEDGAVITGKIAQSVGDLESLKAHFGTKHSFRCKSVRVGNGKPSFTIISVA